MTSGAAFLGGAHSRLLPARIPFRFFAAAATFHVALWPLLWLAADELPGYAGGTGPVLAAIHALTLGILASTAIGAALQLLPVASRKPIVRVWPADLCFWLLVPGTCVLIVGMLRSAQPWLLTGAGLVGVGLLVFAALTIDNLRRAGGMPVVAGHGWGAVLALIGLVALGVALIEDYRTGFLADHGSAAAAHMMLGVFGFMGLLAFGFSHILVPMFALSRALPMRPAWFELSLAVVAVTAGTAGFAAGSAVLVGIGIAIGLAASMAYLWLMRWALATRMRKRLGLSFALIRAAWAALVLGLLIGAAAWLDAPLPNAAAIFGVMILLGWLLTFLLAILQRIMPFLASMHVAGRGGKPPLMSDLTPAWALRGHAGLHLAAVLLCFAGVALDVPTLIRAGAVLGLLGALSFAWFAGAVLRALAFSRAG